MFLTTNRLLNSLWIVATCVKDCCLILLVVVLAFLQVGNRCEVCQAGVSCTCCGMALPANRKDRERLKQLRLRRKVQDRIIRIIKEAHQQR